MESGVSTNNALPKKSVRVIFYTIIIFSLNFQREYTLFYRMIWILIAQLFVSCLPHREKESGSSAPVAEEQRSEPAVEDKSLPQSEDKGGQPQAGFGLIGELVTDANRCTQGDLGCIYNGLNLACAHSNGVLGLCMRNRFSRCECNSLANSPLLAQGDLPHVASEQTCSTTSVAPCNFAPMGSLCTTPQNETGYCAASTFSNSSCRCVAVSAKKTMSLGRACDYSSSGGSPCRDLREGEACLTATKETGFCSGSSSSSGNACSCIAALKEEDPVRPVVICLSGAPTALACRNATSGNLCVTTDGSLGACQVNSPYGNGYANCDCAPTTMVMDRADGTCAAQSANCSSKAIGERCRQGSTAITGACALTDGNSSVCACVSSNKEPEQPPPAPTTFVLLVKSSSRIDLAWTDAATNETNYEVERAPDLTNYTKIATLPANSAAYTDIGLAAGTRYYYRVRAVNAAGASAYVTVSAVTESPGGTPNPPTGLSVQSKTASVLALTWTDGSNDEDNFEVERSLDGTTYGTRRTVPADTVTFTDNGLQPQTLYYYRVRAINAGGPSSWLTSSGTTLAAPKMIARIEVKLPGTQVLQLAEVQVLHADTGESLQQQGTATQSSTNASAVASRANDGTTNGNYAAGSVAHTSSQAGAWWQLTFANPVPVGRLIVWNRTDCCAERLEGAIVTAYGATSNILFSGTVVNAAGAGPKFEFNIPR